MKIEVERIKDKNIEVEENVPASSWDMDSFDIKFIDDISLDCSFFRAGREIIVDTVVITHRIITCSRCLSEVGQTIKQSFKLNYYSGDLGNYLIVDDDIREQILLNFPLKVLCDPNCKGICKNCGANLNFEKCKCRTYTQ